MPLDLSGLDSHEFNFAFPLRWEALENDVVKLVPFVSRTHGELFWSKFSPDREVLMQWMPWSPPTTLELFLALLEHTFPAADSTSIVMSVVDKSQPDDPGVLGGALAGLIGLANTNADNLCTEVGPVLTLRAYQRTHVTANAVGILLRYCLNLPSDAEAPGLGLRRVAWTTSPMNVGSQRTAERMGFVKEGVSRWKWVVPREKEAGVNTPRPGDPDRRPGRDSINYAICWDDWERDAKDVVKERMASSLQRSNA